MEQLSEETTEVLDGGAKSAPVSLAALEPLAFLGRPLGEILVATEGLLQEKLEEALIQQAERGGRIGEVLVTMKLLTEEQVLVIVDRVRTTDQPVFVSNINSPRQVVIAGSDRALAR